LTIVVTTAIASPPPKGSADHDHQMVQRCATKRITGSRVAGQQFKISGGDPLESVHRACEKARTGGCRAMAGGWKTAGANCVRTSHRAGRDRAPSQRDGGCGVGQQVPHDRQDGVAGGDDRAFLAAAVGQEPVAVPEERVGTGQRGPERVLRSVGSPIPTARRWVGDREDVAGWDRNERCGRVGAAYRSEVQSTLRQVPGFRGARLLRRNVDDETEVVSLVPLITSRCKTTDGRDRTAFEPPIWARHGAAYRACGSS
jgi:hypothetical protein